MTAKKVCGEVPSKPVIWICRGVVAGDGVEATSICEVEARLWWTAREAAEQILGLPREQIECVMKGEGQ